MLSLASRAWKNGIAATREARPYASALFQISTRIGSATVVPPAPVPATPPAPAAAPAVPPAALVPAPPPAPPPSEVPPLAPTPVPAAPPAPVPARPPAPAPAPAAAPAFPPAAVAPAPPPALPASPPPPRPPAWPVTEPPAPPRPAAAPVWRSEWQLKPTAPIAAATPSTRAARPIRASQRLFIVVLMVRRQKSLPLAKGAACPPARNSFTTARGSIPASGSTRPAGDRKRLPRCLPRRIAAAGPSASR